MASTEPSPDATGTVKGQPTKRRSLSRRRKWGFRVAAICLALLPFFLIEFTLRLCGMGYETRLVVPMPDAAVPNTFQFNPAADRAYYGVVDLWGPDPRPFQIPKPADTFRIVVIGGSTVAGFPYPFELALPHQLEAVLASQHSERQFEVLNTGMTAITSTSEVDNVRQAIACQPDLIVAHTGHNEFYGPGGSASTANRLTSGIPGLTRFVKRQRSFQLLASLMRKPTDEHLVSTLPADIGIPLDGPVFQSTQDRFRNNLTRMVELARRANIPVLLSTVPSNVRDMAPLQPTVDEATLADLKRIDMLMSYREYEDALAATQKARVVHPNDPLVAYRAGQCFEQLGRRQEAADAYVRAANLDGCRLRAATSFLNVVDEVASIQPQGVYFCDAAETLQARSEFPAPGNDFFLEHVHYNLEGTWQVASILAQSITEQVLKKPWQSDRLPDAEQRDSLLGITPLDHLAGDSLTAVLFDAWPFNLSPARDAEKQQTSVRLATRFQAIAPAERALFANLSLDAMHQHLWLAMGDAWLENGNPQESLTAFERHIFRRPWEAAGYLGAARALSAAGKNDQAELMRERAKSFTLNANTPTVP